MILAVLLAGSLLILIGSGCDESSTSAEETTTESEASASTPKERVRQALGDEVSASGYAGDVQIQDVSFEGKEAQVTVKTPEGGLEGASCGDLDDGAHAILETIYNDGGWKRGTILFYQGGLVDSSTGEELPDRITGTYTMPVGKAKQIDWTNEDALLNIDWSIYRDFCHPALS